MAKRERERLAAKRQRVQFSGNPWQAAAQETVEIQNAVRGMREGIIDRAEAIGRLKDNRSARCILLAGQLALDMAYDVRDTTAARGSFLQATHLFRQAVQKGRMSGERDPFAAQAMLHLGHMEVTEKFVLEGRLPTTATAQRAYKNTIKVGELLTKGAQADATDAASTRNIRRGMQGEAAVLALTERAGLEIGSKDWFPLMAPWSQRRSMYDASKRDGWNVGVYTSAPGSPNLAYRVQVRRSQSPSSDDSEYEEGIVGVNVYPDLWITNDGHGSTAINILEECARELTGSGPRAAEASDRLNRRTDKLLHQIDA